MAKEGGIERGFISKNALMENALTNFKIRTKDQFLDCGVTDTDAVRVAEDLSAALPIVFTISVQPDHPRTLTYILLHANITKYTLVFVGVDARGNVITESHNEVHASPWARTTNNAFAQITSITMTARTGTGVADTCDIGWSDNLGLSNKIKAAASVYRITKNGAHMAPVDYLAEAVYHTVNVSVGAGIGAGDDFAISYEVTGDNWL
jgi:hypothetical protein